MSKIAIITARGGSKRIPRKNVRSFLGKPIIGYGIHAAIKSGLFDEVMVSTDDAEIAEVATSFGANVPFFRSAKNSDDYAGTSEVIIEVLQQYASLGRSFDFGCCIYPTAPFITPELLRNSFTVLVDGGFDCVFPALPFTFPIQRALRINQDHTISMFQPEHFNSRSQDLEKAYHDSGQFYFFKPASLFANGRLYTNNTSVIVLNEMQAHDIDDEDDWKVAEFKYQLLHGK